MRSSLTGLPVAIVLAGVAMLAGGCHRRPCGIITQSVAPPNANMVFGSASPVLPPPGWEEARRYAYDSRTLPPGYFPGALDYYEEYTRDDRRSPSDSRFRQRATGIRSGYLYR
jgi:hypothetical protein